MTYPEAKFKLCQYEGGCKKSAKIRGFCCPHYSLMWRQNSISINRPTALESKLKKTLSNITARCETPTAKKYSNYGGKGIKNFLTIADLIKLWHRDSAKDMRQPSIDRKDSDSDYTQENCRFVEFDDNRKHLCKPNRKCANCEAPFFGSHPNAKYCGSCGAFARRPLRNCRNCRKEFFPDGNLRKRCTECDAETRLCTYCSTPIIRSRGKDGGTMRNKHWFCSKREFGLWIASRIIRDGTKGFIKAIAN